MPTYQYRCSNCGAELEEFQKMSDPALVKCPSCGLETLARIVTGGAGVIYKGEGWYVTDYSHKSSGGREASETSSKEQSDKPSGPAKSEPGVKHDPGVKSEPAVKSEPSVAVPKAPAKDAEK